LIFIAADHAGFTLKSQLLATFPNLEWKDLGPANTDSVDYPDYADFLAVELKKFPEALGVLICGSGQGMAIRANRYPHIRAGLCFSEEMARLSRAHNNANVLCLGSRFTDIELAKKILDVFLNTPFEGGRHERRVHKLTQKI